MALFHGKSDLVLKACSIFFAVAQFEIEHAQNEIELVQKKLSRLNFNMNALNRYICETLPLKFYIKLLCTAQTIVL